MTVVEAVRRLTQPRSRPVVPGPWVRDLLQASWPVPRTRAPLRTAAGGATPPYRPVPGQGNKRPRYKSRIHSYLLAHDGHLAAAKESVQCRAVLRGSACWPWSYGVRNLSRPGHATRPFSLRVASCGDSPLPENITGISEKDRKAVGRPIAFHIYWLATGSPEAIGFRATQSPANEWKA